MTVPAFITIINRAIRRTKPIARIDLDVFDPFDRRAAYVYLGNMSSLGRAANQEVPK